MPTSIQASGPSALMEESMRPAAWVRRRGAAALTPVMASSPVLLPGPPSTTCPRGATNCSATSRATTGPGCTPNWTLSAIADGSDHLHLESTSPVGIRRHFDKPKQPYQRHRNGSDMTIALSTTLHASFDEAVELTREALAQQGFGILTEI